MGRQRTHPIDVTSARSFDALKAWPQDALDWLHVAFERKRVGAGQTYEEILAEVKRQWNLYWNDSSLSRYYGYWRSTLYVEDRARDEATAIVERLVSSPSPDLVAAAKQLLQQQRLLALTRMDAADPLDVVRSAQSQDKIDLARDKIALDREKKLLQDDKLKIDQDRLQLERERQAAIDRPSLFLDFWKLVVETIATASPEGASVLNQHFDQVMAKIKAASA